MTGNQSEYLDSGSSMTGNQSKYLDRGSSITSKHVRRHRACPPRVKTKQKNFPLDSNDFAFICAGGYKKNTAWSKLSCHCGVIQLAAI